MKKDTLKGKFKPSTAAERQFYKQLKKVAQVSGHVVDRYSKGAFISAADQRIMMDELNRYSEKLTPWAMRQAEKMLQQVKNSNKRAYQQKSKAIGTALNVGVGSTRTNEAALLLMNEQVGLIKSIPVEAGLRAQKIALEAALHGNRAVPDPDTIKELETQMELSTEVATSRALLIARTETARANATINQVRAMSVGSAQYRWHNSGDASVRESHKTYKGRPIQGRIFSWDAPPTLSDGMTGHPGTFPNCRCFAEPVFDDE